GLLESWEAAEAAAEGTRFLRRAPQDRILRPAPQDRSFGFQGDGDGDVGETSGQGAVAGKGFGEVSGAQVEFETAPAVFRFNRLLTMGLETGGQDAQGLGVDAAVIEEQGFDKRRVFGAALALLALELVEQQGGGGGS